MNGSEYNLPSKPSKRGISELKKTEVSRQLIEDYGVTALSSPYSGFRNPETGMMEVEPEYFGMTNYEVIWLRMAQMAAQGSLDHAKYVMDRTIGRPKQSIESTNININYENFLDRLVQEETVNTIFESEDYGL
jgi:hypothetical protein